MIFLSDSKDGKFIPAVLQTPLIKVMSVVDTHLYRLSEDNFGSSIKSDVFVFSVNLLKLKMDMTGTSPEDLENSEYLSCFSAGLVNSFYELGHLVADYSKIGDICDVMIIKENR